MRSKKNYFYFFIEALKEVNLDYVKNIGAILILRNPDNLNLTKLKKFKKKCSERNIDLYISNNIKILFKIRSNKLYISSHNKKRYEHIKRINTKIDIIGSAHNIFEINEKLQQGCKKIILSRLFKTNYKYKSSWLGTTKFNIATRKFSTKFIALGGINKKNFKKLKILNIEGFAMSSDKKKAGNYLPAFFKK